MSDTCREDVAKRGSSMRDKAMAIAMKRKEEYLGARVPKALKERVIKKADEMNIPVSLLMRRLLEQSFPEENLGAVNLDIGGLKDNEASLTRESNIASSVEAKEQSRYADIIGWKQMEVNQDRSCERCKEPLPKGTGASLGFTPSGAGYLIVCQQCKTQLLQSSD